MASRKVVLGNGNICKLWKDQINDAIPFCDQYTMLVDLCQVKDCAIKDVFDADFVILFRRTLGGDVLATRMLLKRKFMH
jgi:hypothetical protein